MNGTPNGGRVDDNGTQKDDGNKDMNRRITGSGASKMGQQCVPSRKLTDNQRSRLEKFRAELRERWHRRCSRDKSQEQLSRAPRYDEIYETGAAWLDAIARGDICEDCGGERCDTEGLATTVCDCVVPRTCYPLLPSETESEKETE